MLNRIRRIGATPPKSNGEAGFICPMCKAVFEDPSALTNHFDEAHGENDKKSTTAKISATSSPQTANNAHVENSTSKNDTNFSADNLIFKEENGRLKRELHEKELLIGKLNKNITELEKYKNLGEDAEMLQQQLTMAIETNEAIARQKDNVEQKAANLAKAVAGLKADCDEISSTKEDLFEKNQNLSIELEKAAAWVKDLESQLMQRPSLDDVNVLKKELVSVQMMMNQMTLDSEKEKETISGKNQDLASELTELQDQNSKLNYNFEKLNTENQELKKTLEDSMKNAEGVKFNLKQNHDQQAMKLQENLENLQLELQHEQSHSHSVEEKNDILQGELNQFRLSAEEFEKKLLVTVSNLRKMEIDKDILKETVLKLQNEKISTKKDFENQMKNKNEELESLKQELLERRARSDSLQLTQQDLSQQQKELQKANDDLKQKNHILQKNCSELTAKNQELEMKFSMSTQEQTSNALELEIKVKSLGEVKKQLQSVIDEKNQNLQTLQDNFTDEKSGFQTTILNKEKANVKLQLEFEHLQADHKASIAESNVLQTSLKESEKENTAMTEQLQELQLKFGIAVENEKNLNQVLQKTELKLNGEIKEKENLSSELKKLQDERSSLLKNIEAGEGQNEVISQLETENQSLRLRENNLKQKLLDLKTSNEEMLCTAQDETKSLKSDLMQSQQNTDSLKSELEKITQKHTILNHEHSDLINKYEEKCSLLREEIQKSSQTLLDLTSESQSYKNQLHDKLIEYEKVTASLNEVRNNYEAMLKQYETEKKTLQEEIVELQKQLCTNELLLTQSNNKTASLEEQITTSRTENDATLTQHQNQTDKLKMSHKTVMKALQEKLKSAESENIVLNSTVDSLNSKCQVLDDNLSKAELTIASVQANLSTVSESLKTVEMEYDAYKNNAMEKKGELQQEIKTISQMLENKNINFEKITESLVTENNNLKDNLASNDKLLSEKTHEIQGLVNESTTIKDDLNQKIVLLSSSNEKLSELEKECNLLRKELAEVNQQLSTSNINHIQLSEKLDSQKLSQEAVILSKQKTIDENQSNINHLKTEISSKTEHIDRITTEIFGLKNNLETKGSQITELEKLLTEKNAIYQNAEKKIRELTEVANQFTVISERNAELLNLLDEEQKKMENITAELEITSKELNAHKEANKAQTEKYKAEETTLNVKINEMQAIIDDVKNKLDIECKSRFDAENTLKEENEKLGLELKHKENMWTVEKQELLESQSTLKGAQQILINNKMEIQGKLDKIEHQLKQKHDEIKDIKDKAVKDAKISKEEKDELSIMLAETRSLMEKQKNEKEDTKARFELEIGTLKVNLDAVRSEWQASIQQMDTLKAQCDDSKGHVVVLEATIQNNVDERRALLERCLKAEQQVETKQIEEIQLKNKLEDAHAAMHELGRENQALQVKHTSVLSRQWTDDKQAIECKSCGAAFSLTVRRHHCRHCGNIYCAECSAKTATVAASKKPVRVCDKCYDDLFTLH